MHPTIHSPYSHCDFPSITQGPASLCLALQYQLEKSERLSPEALEALQFKQFAKVMDHAMRTTVHYREAYRPLNITPEVPMDRYVLEHLPILRREDVQGNLEALTSNSIPQQHGRVHKSSSSGSTGRPVEALQTQLTSMMWHAFTLREHLWHQRDLSQSLAAIRYAPDGRGSAKENVKMRGWGPSTDQAFRTGPSHFLNILTDVKEQVKWLSKIKPTYLLTHASNLLAIAEHCLDNNITLPGLREVRSLGEAVPDKLRDVCRDVWGVKVADLYSSQEVGYIALQCPKHEHYHIQSEGLIVEILDEQNRTCLPGEIGRVVVTTLHNFASPLIRYEIGDYAEVGEPCDCGRNLPVLKRILGRTRNMLRMPNGGQKWPVFGFKEFEKIAPVKQMQVIQTAVDKLEVLLVVPGGAIDEPREKQFREIMQRSLGYPFQIDFQYVNKIERSAGGKFEEFICRVAA